MFWFLRIPGNKWFLRITAQEWCCISVPLPMRPCWGLAADSTAGVAASPRQKGLNPHPNPWGLLISPNCTWTSTCSDVIACSCFPALRPTICHDMPWYSGALLPLLASQVLTRAGPWGGTARDPPPHKGQGRCSHLNVRGGRTDLVHCYALKFCSLQIPLGQGFTAMQSVLITPYEFYSSPMWDLCSAIKWRYIISGTRNLKLML